MAQFSGAAQLGGLDDFIAPSQRCVKPLIDKSRRGKEERERSSMGDVLVQVSDEGVYSELAVKGDTKSAVRLEAAEISLQDCLACSGCVTSAETVLVTEQNITEFVSKVSIWKEADGVVVVSIAPQVVASIAAVHAMELTACWSRLNTLFRTRFNASHVLDVSFAREISLLETVAEMEARLSSSTGALPLLAGACPGWVCYAEKSHGQHVLPLLSRVKSPQQIMGTVVKHLLRPYHPGGEADGRTKCTPRQIYHVSLMPCYDKKLEGARDDFASPYRNADSDDDEVLVRDVDCILTSVELIQLLNEQQINFQNLEATPMETPYFLSASYDTTHGASSPCMDTGSSPAFRAPGGSSGGYAQAVVRMAADQRGVALEDVQWTQRRNADFQETAVPPKGSTIAEKSDMPPLMAAKAYGFRNIQNVVRMVKRARCPYHYVEVMACPSGCSNGGGQARPILEAKDLTPKELLQEVESRYNDADESLPSIDKRLPARLYGLGRPLGSGPGSKISLQYTHTEYHVREPLPDDVLAVQW